MRLLKRACVLSLLASPAVATIPWAAAAAENGAHPNGKSVFMDARCYACHGQYGNGTVGPRLRENRFVGLPDYVVGQILVGRGVMPSFAESLDDQQIAAVATYIRTSWGNNFGAVSASQVADIRQKVKLNPPPGQPHLPPDVKQPPQAPVAPLKPMPPGQAQPPASPH
ncbi:MAG TPA: cytochrome c [Xanthobacteraceae bacterium]